MIRNQVDYKCCEVVTYRTRAIEASKTVGVHG